MTLMSAPPNYHWQQWLERTFPAYPPTHAGRRKEDTELKNMEEATAAEPHRLNAQPKFSLWNTMTKWFLDCITLGALMNTIAFFILMGIMKGQSGSQIGLNIKNVSFLSSLPNRKYVHH